MCHRRIFLGRLSLIFFLAGQSAFSQTAIDESEVWRDFLGWLRKQPPIAGSVLIPTYRSQLVGDGVPASLVDTYISSIQRLSRERRIEITAIEFDKMYVAGTPIYSKQPNAFLVGVVSGLKPGAALDAAMGQGRNAFFLAEKGWEVTGFDIAGEGLRLAGERAAAAGRHIHTIQATHRDFDFGRNRWDLIVLTYSWAPFDDPGFMRRISDSLKPGGLVVVEDNEGSLHVRDAGVNPPLKWFDGLRILRYEQAPSGGEWGNPENTVYRLLALKPQ